MKSPEAFRSISEVSAALGVPQHTLRAWEARFPFVKPIKRADGRRYYRPSDVAMLAELHRRLSEETQSTEDIVRLHRTGGLAPPSRQDHELIPRLRDHVAVLTAVRARLAVVLG